MKIGQKCKIVNHSKELNGIITKVVDYNLVFNIYLVEIVDKIYYKWIDEEYLQPIYRKDKLKRLLK